MSVAEAQAALQNAEQNGTPLDVEIARRDLNKLMAQLRGKRKK